ncbi:hypothetical protein PoB_004631900 [Plakobranchus ocellatus]|uniref:Uncharacterized protein n=1 Tax=Plakobranchus ocellatus TaxID=259542 RepID=A0AAV4BN95_9GAST|nr:hypothetical protein PoB_004631900 [Plakobranchus ocellatus]
MSKSARRMRLKRFCEQFLTFKDGVSRNGKKDDVVQEMCRMNLTITRLAEVLWKGASAIKVGSKELVYSGGGRGDTHERGAGTAQNVWEANVQFQIE